jgi:hypothetical protein
MVLGCSRRDASHVVVRSARVISYCSPVFPTMLARLKSTVMPVEPVKNVGKSNE